MEQAETLDIKVWKHDYIFDKSKPTLVQLLGLEDDEREITYEDIFDAINYDAEGAECKLDGIEEARKSVHWMNLGHSNNFEMRWCWVARTAIINIVKKDYCPMICHKIDKWGRVRENRAKFGRILDYMAKIKLPETKPDESEKPLKGVKLTEVCFSDESKKAFEDFLVDLSPELFEPVKEMAEGDSFTNGNTFVKSDDQKKIFDRLISNMNAYDWDAVFLVQYKGVEFVDKLSKPHCKIFRKAIKMVEDLARFHTAGNSSILSPGKTSLDFLSFMADGFDWKDGIMVGQEQFTHESIPYITKKLPKRNPFEALTAYAFYLIEAKDSANQLMRIITDNPSRLKLLMNMVTHKGTVNRQKCNHEPNKPFIDVEAKEFNDIGDCIEMLNPVSDEDCFCEEGKPISKIITLHHKINMKHIYQ